MRTGSMRILYSIMKRQRICVPIRRRAVGCRNAAFGQPLCATLCKTAEETGEGHTGGIYFLNGLRVHYYSNLPSK